MKKLMIYQVDAFAEQTFTGNPAAVCPLDEWIEDSLMQQIAMENNLAETAFFVKKGEGFEIRWFTPEVEVNLCGHATLASAWVLFYQLGYQGKDVVFYSKSGILKVINNEPLLMLDFPLAKMESVSPPEMLVEGLNAKIEETWLGEDYLVKVENERTVREISPDLLKLGKLKGNRGVIVTAPGDTVDFVSRFFGPAVGINEDPVTGSAHTMLVPFWEKITGKKEFHARQVSKRGGNLYCSLNGDRVKISGKAALYLKGEIFIEW